MTVRGVVLFPPLQKIVPAHVGLVSHGHEARQAQIPSGGLTQDGDPESPRGADANPTCPKSGVSGAKVASIDTDGLVLMTPKQFGPTIRMP